MSETRFAGDKPQLSPNKKIIEDIGRDRIRESFRDERILGYLGNSYLNQYTSNSNVAAYSLAVKESLDHYIVERFSENPTMFVKSQEFKNYSDYIMKIARDKKMRVGKSTWHPEFFTNPVFSDKTVRETIFRTAYTDADLSRLNKWYDEQRKNYEKTIRYYAEIGMGGHHRLSQQQMDLVGDYIYAGRNVDDGVAERFARYCFNDVDDESPIKPSIPMIGALTSYFASQYTIDEDVRRNSRFYIAGRNRRPNDMRIGSSSSIGCVMQGEHFLGMSLTSDNSLNKSRTNQSNDLYRLMMISFHELTHDHQRNALKRGEKNSSAMAQILKIVLNREGEECYRNEQENGVYTTYYKINHDNDEIEIQADEEAWLQCRAFLVAHKDGFRAGCEQWQKCIDNAKEVRARRSFVQKNTPTGEGMPAIQFDIQELESRIKAEPKYLRQFPQLQHFVDSSGHLKPKFLFQDRVAAVDYSNNNFDVRTDVFGAEAGAYMLTDIGESINIVEYIRDNSENIPTEQAKRFMYNLYHIIHQNIDKVRTLESINFDNYDETRTRGKQLSPETMRTALFQQYILQCYNAMHITDVMKETFPDLSDFLDQQEKYFFQYYDEFSSKATLGPKFAARTVQHYEKSANSILRSVAQQIRKDYSHSDH